MRTRRGLTVPFRRLRLLTAGALALALVVVLQASATSFTEQKLIAPGGGQAGAQFARAVVLDGDTAVVGAPATDTGAGGDAGAVDVYVRSGGVWSLQQELKANDGAAGDLFGCSVDVSGNTLIAGARGATVAGNLLAGAAYVYTRSGTNWTLQQKLVASDPHYGDGFGFAVAIDGDNVLAGAWGDNTLRGPDAGSVYAFSRSGTVWTQDQKFLARNGQAKAVFGASISMSGATAIIGAFGQDDTFMDQGVAYAYVRSGTAWSYQQTLIPSDAQESAVAGYAVGLSGDVAVIGAPLQDTGAGADAGEASVFVRTGTTWAQQKLLRADDAAAGDQFGSAVAIDGTTAIVGAQLDDTTAGPDAGSAYLFTSDGLNWTQSAHLFASEGAADDQFGTAAAFSAGISAVGAPLADTGGADAGAAYAYQPATGHAPVITSFTPTSGITGITVTINGSNFDGTTGVKLGNTKLKFKVLSPSQIRVTIPDGSTSGPFTVTTPDGSATSSSNFVVTFSITKISPKTGPVGTVVTFTGVGFGNVTSVKFHNTTANFTIISPTSIQATVPAGATTGKVSATSSQGTVRGPKFTVTP